MGAAGPEIVDPREGRAQDHEHDPDERDVPERGRAPPHEQDAVEAQDASGHPDVGGERLEVIDRPEKGVVER
jgi:hypothetical protein